MPNSKKPDITAELIRKCGRTIVFCRTRAGVDRVGDDLTYDGMAVQTLHGGLTQRGRDRAMERFQARRMHGTRCNRCCCSWY